MSINLETIDPSRNLYKKDNIYLTFSGKPDKGFKKVSSRKVVSFFEKYIKKNSISNEDRKKIKGFIKPIATTENKQTNKVRQAVINFFSRFKNLLSGKSFHSSQYLHEVTRKSAENLLNNELLSPKKLSAKLQELKDKISTAETSLKNKKDAIKENKIKLDGIESKLADLKLKNDNAETLEDIQSQIDALKITIQNTEEEIHNDENNLLNLKQEQAKLEEKLTKLTGQKPETPEAPEEPNVGEKPETETEEPSLNEDEPNVETEETHDEDSDDEEELVTAPSTPPDSFIETPPANLATILTALRGEQADLFHSYVALAEKKLPVDSQEDYSKIIEALASVVSENSEAGKALTLSLKNLLKHMSPYPAEQEKFLEKFFAQDWNSEFLVEFLFNLQGILLTVHEYVTTENEADISDLLQEHKKMENEATIKENESNSSWYSYFANKATELWSPPSPPETGLTSNLFSLMNDHFGNFQDGPTMINFLEQYLQNMLTKPRNDPNKVKFIQAFKTYGANLANHPKNNADRHTIAQFFRENMKNIAKQLP